MAQAEHASRETARGYQTVHAPPPPRVGSAYTPAYPFPAAPSPLPARPKGRWFITAVLLGVVALGGYAIWDAFFRYHAYGVVGGHVVKISPNVDGVVRYVHVREGDSVERGQLLMTIENLKLAQERDRLQDELAVARAELQGATASLKWRSAQNAERHQQAVKEHHELQAKLELSRSELRQAAIRAAGVSKAFEANAAQLHEVERIQAQREGLLRDVDELQKAVAESQQRIQLSQTLLEEDPALLSPEKARIEYLAAELERARQAAEQQQVLSPVDGVVLEVRRRAGEQAHLEGEDEDDDYALALLERGSLQAVLYVPQSAAPRLYEPGRKLRIEMEPHDDPLECTVVRQGDAWVPPPPSISRHYYHNQTLLPVYLEFDRRQISSVDPRPNEVVKLPRQFWAMNSARAEGGSD